VVINNGSIVKVDPINVKNIEELPVLEVVGKKNSIGISEVSSRKRCNTKANLWHQTRVPG
jgi:hypothetical protein